MSHDQVTADLRQRIGQTSAMLRQVAAQDREIAEGASARRAAKRLRQVMHASM